MALTKIILIHFLLFLGHLAVKAEHKNLTRISLGSKLFPTSESSSWFSPSRRFAFGFYNEGNGFRVGIWFTENSEKVVTWTANRDDLPVSPYSTIELTPDGKLILVRAGYRSLELATNISKAASSASMNDNGNFLLYDEDSNVIWESFKYPTDTLLEGQALYPGFELLSSVSEENHSTGRFRLSMQLDGNLVSYPIHTLNIGLDAYWATDTSLCHGFYLYLNNTGEFKLLNISDSSLFYTINPNGRHSSINYDRISSTNYGLHSSKYDSEASFYANTYNGSVLYRGKLQHNGLFELFAHFYDAKGLYNKTLIVWSVPEDQCTVKSFCGFNSYCTKNDDEPFCHCLPGTKSLDRSDDSTPARRHGCERNFTEEFCSGSTSNASLENIFTMEYMTWDDPPYSKAEMMTKEDCMKACLEDCDCEVALFGKNDEFGRAYCMKQKLPLVYARRVQTTSIAIFKIGKKGFKSQNVPSMAFPEPRPILHGSKYSTVLILVVTLGLVACSCAAIIVAGIFFFKLRVFEYEKLLECGGNEVGLGDELTLRSFSYNELKRATEGFKEELGRGSFGSVYKGIWNRGRKRAIAVKRLEKIVTEGEREFRAEMRVIGRTHHKNLVRLLGYCAEQTNRLLVYEYMSNRSLADILFGSARRRPEWTERVRIILDIARGILYLHEECETPIIHCDIKPQNILMDEFWTAKISDFGLAKLLMPDQTRTITVVRGTRGYLAPEWNQNVPISVKADVYSFGVVLLETVCCRKNMELNASRPEEIILASWVYKNFIAGEVEKAVKGEEVERKSLEKLVKIGLWCIQDDPALRPSMKSVVMMLEGVTEVSVPPCPSTAYHFN